MADQSQRFIFEDTDIRGEVIHLSSSYQDILANQNYSEPVAKLLGEFLCASALLSSTIKFEGSLTLQARSEGEISLIMAESSSDLSLRAIAKADDITGTSDFQELLSNGQLSITIDPVDGNRYQGIVSLEGNDLAGCIESYFRQSEQLNTRLFLTADDMSCAGMLIQQLPATLKISEEARDIQWEHVTKLADTLTAEELLSLNINDLLFRLYHQDKVRLFEAKQYRFQCSCSRERTMNALTTLSPEELSEIIVAQGAIDINCEFCNARYLFEQADIDHLLSRTLH